MAAPHLDPKPDAKAFRLRRLEKPHLRPRHLPRGRPPPGRPRRRPGKSHLVGPRAPVVLRPATEGAAGPAADRLSLSPRSSEQWPPEHPHNCRRHRWEDPAWPRRVQPTSEARSPRPRIFGVPASPVRRCRQRTTPAPYRSPYEADILRLAGEMAREDQVNAEIDARAGSRRRRRRQPSTATTSPIHGRAGGSWSLLDANRPTRQAIGDRAELTHRSVVRAQPPDDGMALRLGPRAVARRSRGHPCHRGRGPRRGGPRSSGCPLTSRTRSDFLGVTSRRLQSASFRPSAASPSRRTRCSSTSTCRLLCEIVRHEAYHLFAASRDPDGDRRHPDEQERADIFRLDRGLLMPSYGLLVRNGAAVVIIDGTSNSVQDRGQRDAERRLRGEYAATRVGRQPDGAGHCPDRGPGSHLVRRRGRRSRCPRRSSSSISTAGP